MWLITAQNVTVDELGRGTVIPPSTFTASITPEQWLVEALTLEPSMTYVILWAREIDEDGRLINLMKKAGRHYDI